MTPDDLFSALDLDADGRLSRDELERAAVAMGWHWCEAPFYALLDRATLAAPLSRKDFAALLAQIEGDPLGPYGEVLTGLHSPGSTPPSAGPVTDAKEALLIIDPQRSFTSGAWMRSMGPGGEAQIAPIERAFRACATRLGDSLGHVELGLTRCPFPPASYGWNPDVAQVLAATQPYFIKPGNSALWPPTNGVAEWIEGLLDRGVQRLVIGGCTLNSCVRVSALDLWHRFGDQGLQVVVDLDLAGARLDNHTPSPLFGGLSSVAAAIAEMRGAGVEIVGTEPT